MLINRRNAGIIIIKYRGKGKIRFTFPISLYSFSELFEAFKDLLEVMTFIFPKQNKIIINKVLNETGLPFSNIIEMIHQILSELKLLRGTTLLEVDFDEVYIKVSVY
ncbi:hypothetical protein GC105_13325 [Alkalibaculum sp. M08DMB]|uniref:Uncharacterized protein n=1 Tax=Alkalibaculum sporogenes TaxID=2655001 RepID=A0A6A7KC61_9FIRM|nr:hypothetical protein [Alkalibaculum sporogenes]MPW26767.1 hypothetical protein [Alkalibaculum sporogenes]